MNVIIRETKRGKDGWKTVRVDKGPTEEEVKNYISNHKPDDYQWDYREFSEIIVVSYRLKKK